MNSERMNEALFKIANETLASIQFDSPENFGDQIAKALEQAFLAGAEDSGKKEQFPFALTGYRAKLKVHKINKEF